MATPAGENTNKSAQDKKSNEEFAKETPAMNTPSAVSQLPCRTARLFC